MTGGIMIERCALWLAGAFFCMPCLGQGPVEGVVSSGAQARLRQCVEVAIGSVQGLGARDVRQLLQRFMDVAERGGVTLPAGVMDTLRTVDDTLLPAVLRVYLPTHWNGVGDPPYLICALDARSEMPVEKWLGMEPAAAPGGVAVDRRGSFFRTVDLPRGGQRLLFGDGWRHVEPALPLFSRPELPDGSPAFRKMRERVQRGAMHAVVDLEGFAPPEVLRGLRGAAGPRATVFGVTVSRTRGRTNLDVHWGCGIGSGMVGQLLPRTSGSSQLSQLVSFRPGLSFQANLGSEFARNLVRSGLLRQIPDPDARATVEEILEVWQGELGWFQPLPPRGYDPPAFAPPSVRLSPEVVFLARVDKDAGDDVIDSIAGVIGRGVRDPDTGTLRLDERHNALHIGHRAGIIAICRADETARAAELIGNVLSAAGGGRRGGGGAALDRELRGPVQLSVSPGLANRMTGQLTPTPHPRSGDASSVGYSLGQALTRQALSGGYGLSLEWDREGMRLRLRF